MSRRMIPLLLVLLAGVVNPVATFGDEEQEPEYEMTTYQFVLLHRGPNTQPIGERQIQRLQEGHLALMSRLHEQGKAIVWGPLDRAGKLRRVLVLDVGSSEEAEAIVQEDPWIQSGRLKAEVHPWWTAKGILQRPGHLLHMSRCYLALLKRPPNAPEYPDEKLREIQAGHMANIQRMADSGDLVLAGPMGDDGELRGIFVFRTLDPERIRELVAQDPAIKAGRLGAEIYPWNIPKGVLPED